jgi:hypothetical protein
MRGPRERKSPQIFVAPDTHHCRAPPAQIPATLHPPASHWSLSHCRPRAAYPRMPFRAEMPSPVRPPAAARLLLPPIGQRHDVAPTARSRPLKPTVSADRRGLQIAATLPATQLGSLSMHVARHWSSPLRLTAPVRQVLPHHPICFPDAPL